jgi:hypothetical protein
MRFRWQPMAALALVPMGVALADYGDSSAVPEPPASVAPDRSAEHLSLVESAERSLDQITRGMHELAIAMQNARRSEDMMLATCLADILEQMRGLQASAIATLQQMHDTTSVQAARGVASSVAAKNEELARMLEAASKCEGGEQGKSSSSSSEVTTQLEPGLDPGNGSAMPSVIDAIDPPGIAPPHEPPPTIDVMEPGTDMPTPPTASPMR